jgi:hypothetical protein
MDVMSTLVIFTVATASTGPNVTIATIPGFYTMSECLERAKEVEKTPRTITQCLHQRLTDVAH